LVGQALHLKELNNQKRLATNAKSIGDMTNVQTRQFILTRKLGHEVEIVGSQHWQVHKESWDQCYVCDRKIYSVFFWSPQLGKIEGAELELSQDEKYRIARYVLSDRQINHQRMQKNLTLDQSL
jgi:hypothetical protein